MTDELQKDQLIAEEEIIDEPASDHYELLYIISANYTASEIKPFIQKVDEAIKELDGVITKTEDMGKLKLAYPIKHLSHGYYQLVEFDLLKSNLKDLNRALLLNNNVLRFLVVKKKIKTEEEIKKEKDLQAKLTKRKEQEIDQQKAAKEDAKEKPKKEKPGGKVSLEDLDKKLDEILGSNDLL